MEKLDFVISLFSIKIRNGEDPIFDENEKKIFGLARQAQDCDFGLTWVPGVWCLAVVGSPEAMETLRGVPLVQKRVHSAIEEEESFLCIEQSKLLYHIE